MKTFFLFLLLSASISAAQTMSDVDMIAHMVSGIAELGTAVSADGQHTFNFAGKPPKRILKKSGMTIDQWVDQMIGVRLSQKEWCPDGWEILERGKSVGFITAQGRCL